ncbi:MAG: MFS transporter [Methylobacteriaceae bacterium]|nr:MFS transporter [Methylobacteriaceae bacterium]
MDAATPDHLRPPEPLTPGDLRSIFVGVMLALFLSALDQTIVATAMPTVGRDLGDVQHLPWVVTAYLIASTAATPLYGKFSDMHGRRVTMLIAIGVFLVGSVVCALAPTMLLLVAGRALQGLGGGGLMALSQTIIADLVSPRERGRYQGYFGTVFATSSLLGPLLGGFFAESLHWSLIFWINLPLGALALWLVNARLKKLPVMHRRHRLDGLGALLLVGATMSLMLALSWGGSEHPWTSPPILGLVALSAVLWAGFGRRMGRAPEPLIPLAILRDRVVRTATAAGALAMGTYIGLTIFVPIYYELSLGLTARESGAALIPVMIGVVLGATVSGRTMAVVRHYKRIPLCGLTVSVLALGTVAATAGTLPSWALITLLGLSSVGLGSLLPVATVSVQNAVDPGHLGTATATMNFCRQLGGALLVAAFGALVLGGGSVHGLSPDSFVRGGADLSASFGRLFWAATAGLAGSLAFLVSMEERPLRERRATAPAEDQAAS